MLTDQRRDALEAKGFSPAILNLMEQLTPAQTDLWFETMMHMTHFMVLRMNRTNAEMEKETQTLPTPGHRDND